MPADPREAGRKGGRSKSPAKLAAARRNGFQKRPGAPANDADCRAMLAACEESIDAGKPTEARLLFGAWVQAEKGNPNANS